MTDPFFSVAPTEVASERNTLRAPLKAVAVWELDDVHFAFDSSVLLPSMTEELAELIAIIRIFPGTLLSVFGHADTTGNDEYNKVLSGRRALALYGLLTRDVAQWEALFSHPHGGDDWRRDHDFALGLMRETIGPEAAGMARAALFERYMAILARDPAGKPFGLPKRAFLGKGADAKLKADVQGCGEFNPLIMFSAEEVRGFKATDQKERRDAEGAPNRRVTVFLFPGTTKVSVKDWPCPRATEAAAGCRKRFWSDQLARRTFGDNRRRQPEDNDTFACRFYDRIALDGARGRKGLPLGRLVIRAESAAPSLKKRELVVLDPDGNELASAVINPDGKPDQPPPEPTPAEIVLKTPFASGHHGVEKRFGGEPEPSASQVDLQALLGAVLRDRDRIKPDQVVTEDPAKKDQDAKNG